MSKKAESKPNENKVLKYYIDKSTMVWKIVLSALFIIAYIGLRFYENTLTIQFVISELSEEKAAEMTGILNWVNIGESFSVLLVSVFLSSAIASAFTVRENNKTYAELMTNDVFASEDFYKALSEDSKKEMRQTFINGELGNSKILAEIQNHMWDKLTGLKKHHYYFDECILDVTCTIKDDCIIKHITKTLKIKSLSTGKNEIIKDFPLVTSAHIADSSKKYGVSKDSVKLKIGENDCSNKDITSKQVRMATFDRKAGYNECKKFIYGKTLKLNDDTPTEVEIQYETVVPITDLSYVFRLENLCRKFSMYFSINFESRKKYTVDVAAFGFVDDGGKDANHPENKTSATITFDNWIFPLDGVSISILEEKN